MFLRSLSPSITVSFIFLLNIPANIRPGKDVLKRKFFCLPDVLKDFFKASEDLLKTYLEDVQEIRFVDALEDEKLLR